MKPTRLAAILLMGLACLPAARAQPAMVTNGSFEQIDDAGVAVDWEFVGARQPAGTIEVISADAHTGDRCLRLERHEPEGEIGLNREWEPGSGQQGKMLSVLKGGLRFWYKLRHAEKAQCWVYVIPMTEDPIEKTGSLRAAVQLPEEHVGDGQWHQGALKFDFTDNPQVKWVHVSARLRGEVGEMLLDDIEYVEQIGPFVSVGKLSLQESDDRPGERATLQAELRNVGDQPAAEGQVVLSLPEALKLDGGELGVPLPPLDADEIGTVEWRLAGRRTRPMDLTVKVALPGCESRRRLQLRTTLTAEGLVPDVFALLVGEETEVRLWLVNEGDTIIENIDATLETPPPIKLLNERPEAFRRALAPGRREALTWRVRADAPHPNAALRATVRTRRAGRHDLQARLVIAENPSDRRMRFVRDPDKQRQPRSAVLESSKARIVFPPSRYGYGLGLLQVRRDGRWRTVGVLPQLSRLVYRTKRGRRVEELIYAESFDRGKVRDRQILQFWGEYAHADGGAWLVKCAFGMGPDDDFIDVQYTATCDRPAQLLAFEGPMVYAGERSFGAHKTDALFPGLEWLHGPEVSSSALDIAPDHPHRLRYVPHPNMITIPALGVHSPEGTVGLLWDPEQTWDGEHDRPCGVFASPDGFNGRNSHLMGLFVPSVPEWVEPNNREAAVPYELQAGTELSVRAQILLDAEAKDSLAAMDRWLQLYGVPEPRPYPRGSLQEEVQFSMSAYLESLWEEEDKEWWTSRDGNPLMSKRARPPSYCHYLLKGALVSPDEQIAAACRKRADEMAELIGHGPPSGEDLGFDFRGPVPVITGLAGQATATMESQADDGSWSFDALSPRTGVFEGKDYRELGPHGAVEVGICARRAYELLRYALLTGDDEVYAAGRRALEFMKRFTVPRAAQVWEVPVHTPDILAAADAVDAYLEAYRYEGREEDLRYAVYWARAGLPFVYLWDDEERPFVLYASIPVFGATWFRGSWFGRPVQWNGLRYAYALLKLSRYHRDFPWRRIAEGITVSAMYQQEPEGDQVALWPDAISAIDSKKSRWVFGPGRILNCVYALMGRDLVPDTTVLRQGDDRVHVTSGGEVRDAAWEDDELTFEVAYPQGEHGFTLLVGLSEPERVLLNGRELARSDQLESQIAHGWRYDSAHGFLLIRVAADGTWKLAAEGVEPYRVSLVPREADRIDFEFDESTGGWLATHDLEGLRLENGILHTRATGGDPYMVRHRMSLAGDSVAVIRLRMSVTDGAGGRFFWATEGSPKFTEDKAAGFAITTDGEFHEYAIPVADHERWAGQQITAIRLDPTNSAPGAEIRIDWIRAE